MTRSMCINPDALYAKYPTAHSMTRMTAIKYNRLPMALNFDDEI